MIQLKERNPNAFKSKLEKVLLYIFIYIYIFFIKEEASNALGAKHTKGCNCKKQNCTKKYCECYQMKVKCTDLCKCEDCKNIYGHTSKPEKKEEMSYFMQNKY